MTDDKFTAKAREIWRRLKDYPSYEVSSLGQVRSSRGILKGTFGFGGYRAVCFCVGLDKKIYSRVHRLVAITFLGPPPTKKHNVAHLNGRATDNRACNLAWVTKKENEAHKKLHGTFMEGERHHQAKLTVKQVLEIRKSYKAIHQNNTNCKRLAVKYGVSMSTIVRIVNRYKWKHIP